MGFVINLINNQMLSAQVFYFSFLKFLSQSMDDFPKNVDTAVWWWDGNLSTN